MTEPRTTAALERARDRIAGSPLNLDGVYRRRASRQLRRRAGAGILALLITAGGIAAFARATTSTGNVPGGTPTGSTAVAAPVIIDDFAPWVDLRAVAENGVGFVAVGDTSVGDGTDPVWYSGDGVTWTRITGPAGPDSPNLWDVAAGGPGFVAVGIDNHDAPAAWSSADGRTWERASITIPLRVDDAHGMFGVAALGRLFTWGVEGTHPFLWTSLDGLSWDPVADESVFEVAQGHEARIWTVGETADGFVALGWEGLIDHPKEDPFEVEWTSIDGLTWSRVGRISEDEATALEAALSSWDHTVATAPLGTVTVEQDARTSTLRFEPA